MVSALIYNTQVSVSQVIEPLAWVHQNVVLSVTECLDIKFYTCSLPFLLIHHHYALLMTCRHTDVIS